jgi:hypothetical protein
MGGLSHDRRYTLNSKKFVYDFGDILKIKLED